MQAFKADGLSLLLCLNNNSENERNQKGKDGEWMRSISKDKVSRSIYIEQQTNKEIQQISY